jgi:hypothetical protein
MEKRNVSKIKVNKELAEKLKAELEDGKVVMPSQLPLFPELSSAMPHHWTRTTLFTSVPKGGRKMYAQERLASRSDYQILFTGEQLDMSDNDVFLHVLQLAQNQTAGSVIPFIRSKFLHEIGRSDEGSNSYKALEKSLRRLASATLFIENGEGQGRVLRLVKDMSWDKRSGQYWVILDPIIVEFFEKSQIAFIDFEARKQLESPLSKWLQNYASGHSVGDWHHISVENLRVWSGGGEMRNFMSHGRGLPLAVEELQLAGIIDEAEFYTTILEGKKTKMLKWWRPSDFAKLLRAYAKEKPAGWHDSSVEELFAQSGYRTLGSFMAHGKGLRKALSELEKAGFIGKPEIYTLVAEDGKKTKRCRWYTE